VKDDLVQSNDEAISDLERCAREKLPPAVIGGAASQEDWCTAPHDRANGDDGNVAWLVEGPIAQG
jgi:hypothetical protein